MPSIALKQREDRMGGCLIDETEMSCMEHRAPVTDCVYKQEKAKKEAVKQALDVDEKELAESIDVEDSYDEWIVTDILAELRKRNGVE